MNSNSNSAPGGSSATALPDFMASISGPNTSSSKSIRSQRCRNANCMRRHAFHLRSCLLSLESTQSPPDVRVDGGGERSGLGSPRVLMADENTARIVRAAFHVILSAALLALLVDTLGALMTRRLMTTACAAIIAPAHRARRHVTLMADPAQARRH